MDVSTKKIVAIASAGGHWVQLLRLRPAFQNFDVVYVTTMVELKASVPGCPVEIVPDASRANKFKLIKLALRIVFLLVKVRPDVIVTTGAAPGLLAIRLGRFCGARTIWVDSIANADEMSLSGRLAVGRANVVLSQWQHVAGKYDGVHYRGAVL